MAIQGLKGVVEAAIQRASNATGVDFSFLMRTAGNATRINGSVGTSGADLVVTDNVIPSGATQVTSAGGISLSLTITG